MSSGRSEDRNIDTFHDFFLGAAGVAGALIGLLFVAVSVTPHGIQVSSAALSRRRPVAALSAFVNSLAISLLALIPGQSLAGAVEVIASIGLAAMMALLVMLIREFSPAQARRFVWAVGAVAVQAAAYGFELAQSFVLQEEPDSVPALHALAVVIVVLFIVGIERAWEYVGGSRLTLLTTVTGIDQHAPAPRSEVPPSQVRPDTPPVERAPATPTANASEQQSASGTS